MKKGDKSDPCWVTVFETPDVDASVKKVESLGGRVHTPAVDIPFVGRYAIVYDPQNATFGLFTPQSKIGKQQSNGHTTATTAAAATKKGKAGKKGKGTKRGKAAEAEAEADTSAASSSSSSTTSAAADTTPASTGRAKRAKPNKK